MEEAAQQRRGEEAVRTVGNHDGVDWTTRRRLNDFQTSVNLTPGWSADQRRLPSEREDALPGGRGAAPF